MGGGKVLHITLFGTFRAHYKGRPLTDLDSTRVQELFAWLLINRQMPQSRQQTAFTFWPDSSEKQARTNLRQLLYHLRKILPEADRYLKIDHKTIQWDREASYYLDVEEFENKLVIAEKAKQTGNHVEYEQKLVRAEALYQGPLFKNCYKKWIVTERERLQQQYVELLQKLVERMEKKRDFSTALSYAEKLLGCDEYQESTYRTLMRLHALNKDRSNVQKVYQKCEDALSEELDVTPSSETIQLYKRLVSGENMSTEDKSPERGSETKENWPLIGRQKEWKMLLSSWKEILSGGKGCVVISGEPGIGKTRLGLEFLTNLKRQGYVAPYSRSYESAGTLSYGPITDWLRAPPIRDQLVNLEPVWLKEIARLLPELLIEFPDLPNPGPLKEKWMRRIFFEALSKALLISRKSTLLYLDDLQWCDRETLAWLDFLLHAQETENVLVLGTLRPVEGASNEALQNLLADLRQIQTMTEITLGPLDESESIELASEVATGHVNHKMDIYSESEGNPLFLVESIRQDKYEQKRSFFKGWDAGANTEEDTETPSVPPKVNEVISARFEQLSERARELTWLASVFGREFSFDWLVHASDQSEPAMVDSLEELLRHHIIRELRTNAYDFTHDKLREVAYLNMSNARRRLLHKKIAGAIESEHEDEPDIYASQLAFHYDRAHLPRKAIHYYKIAADYSRQMYANEDSVTFLRRALTFVQLLPESKERVQMERELEVGLALTLVQLKGYGSAQVREACNRVFLLCKQLNKPPPASVKRIFAIANLCIARLEKAIELGLKLFNHATETGDGVELVEACYVLGSTYIRQAKFDEAGKYFRKGIKLYNPANEKRHINRFGQDPSVICQIRLAMIMWLTGNSNKADVLARETLKRTEEINHHFTSDYIRTHFAWLCNLKGDVNATREMTEKVLSSSYEYGFPYWSSVCEVLNGWALYHQGVIDKGIHKMRKGITTFEKIGTKIDLPYFSSLLAKALGEQGELDEAATIVDNALNQIHKSGDQWMEAEVHRIQGNIYQMVNPRDKDKAQDSFQKAINVARNQGIPIFVQRASACLEHIQ